MPRSGILVGKKAMSDDIHCGQRSQTKDEGLITGDRSWPAARIGTADIAELTLRAREIDCDTESG
jgi:hypothetical protein